MHAALIDDEPAVLDSLRLYFERQGVALALFASAEAFLEAPAPPRPYDCIVADVRLPGMSGLDFVRKMAVRTGPPIILITGHGDIDMAVAAIKLGAFDFIEKPFDESRLLAAMQEARDRHQRTRDEAIEIGALQSRVASLSERQRQVMDLAVRGLSNKEIATHLAISPRTVEIHRAWMMERLGARNLADLMRIAMRLESRS